MLYSLFNISSLCHAAPKVGDHMIRTYRMSIELSIKLQFTNKRLETGQPGATELACTLNLNKALLAINMTESELIDSKLMPMAIEDVEKVEKEMARKVSRKAT